MSDLFSPPFPEYKDLLLFESSDGNVKYWCAAHSLEEANALFDHNGILVVRNWTKQIEDVPGDFFYKNPSPAILYMRFRRGYWTPSVPTVLYKRPGGIMNSIPLHAIRHENYHQ